MGAGEGKTQGGGEEEEMMVSERSGKTAGGMIDGQSLTARDFFFLFQIETRDDRWLEPHGQEVFCFR